MIRVRSLVVRPGGFEALRGVDLHVARGEIVGLVGPASAGKSTLLKTLCGLHSPASGEAVVDGVDLTRTDRKSLAELRARIGFCFQNLALFDAMDVTRNVAFTLVRRGVPEAEAHERAREQLRAVGLGAAVEKMPHELSGGMKRRLALARAMVSRPAVGLYDDPFVGLDPVACARIANLIAKAHEEAGGATLVAAGDPQPLFAVAHRLVLLDEGRVVVDLPASEFRPETNPAVARYLGRITEEAAA